MTDTNQDISPEQYGELQKKLKAVQQQNQRLQKIVSLGTVSTLSTLIEQYLAFSQLQSREIAKEIQLTDYSRDNVEKVARLLRHLGYVRRMLHVFIDLHERGIIGLSPDFQKCIFTGNVIIQNLESLGAMLDMSEAETAELQGLLDGFRERLEQFIETCGEGRP